MNEQNYIFSIKDQKLILKICNVNEILIQDGPEFKRFLFNIVENTKFLKIILVGEERSQGNKLM